MGSIKFLKVGVIDVWKDLLPLIEAHDEELTKEREQMPLDPDWAKYAALEEMGIYHLFAAYDGAEMVGYAGFFLNTHLHYRNTVVAMNDVLFIRRDRRQGRFSMRFIRYCTDQMIAMGAKRVTMNISVENDWSPLAHHLGYEDGEKVVHMIVGD